ncbi:hypothetical protein CIG75_17750 [Tumebacillus algifaecis]|uniref:Intracellular proteinase inhibitor BsuPI domain-containing protein n=1 Tax=Tumebacillus algifaecis TaxID=1214604 RepID=A0A223D4T2_9BACL|nr:BsuPI-related putative proteinase inhibitor [Tumebacillus algifaecis]ASS76629.1 hypothetical protein CIG75_17750 [Tumebacillus algifaecis]
MLTIRTDKTTYRPHETVLITLLLQNEGAEAREYHFATAQRFDVTAEREGQTLWQWSHDRLFAQMLSTLIIQPGDSRMFKAEWKQTDFNGRQVARGPIKLCGWIVGTEERAETQIELVGRNEPVV